MSVSGLSAFSRLLWTSGWVANHDGNLSERQDDGNFLATPTALSKRLIGDDDLLRVDGTGAVIEGRHKVFSEWSLHAAAYAVRADVRAVIHAHPPHATAAGLTGLRLDSLPLPEAVVSLGGVPTIRFVAPGAEAVAELRQVIDDADVVLIPGNGAIAVGGDLEQAYLRLELLEHLCRILTLARAQGRVARMDPAIERAMLEKRAQAGLGAEGRRRRSAGVNAASSGASPSEAITRAAVAARVAATTGDAQLSERITEAVLARLAAEATRS